MSTSDGIVTRDEVSDLAEAAPGVAGLVRRALRRVNVPSILARSGTAGRIAIDRVTLGQATIDRVNIQGVNATLDAGTTQLEGFRMVLRVRVGIRFRVFGFTRERSVTFGFPFDVGTVSIPRLDDIAVALPSAVATGTQIAVQPVADLELGAGTFDDLRIEGTLLPAAGFGLDGLDLGAVRLRDFEVPATFTEAVSIGRFAPDLPLRLPTTVVTGVRLPDVDVPRVSSSAPIEVPNIRPNDLEQSAGLDLIILSVRVFVRPTIDIRIAALTINDIAAASSIDRIALENISAPVTISGLRLGDVELREVTVNEITV
jgi:hypothetical protein